ASVSYGGVMGDLRVLDMDLSIVIPVYRSAEILARLVDEILLHVVPLGLKFEIILINDRSPDDSWLVIQKISERLPNILGVNLRKNCGQHNAIMAGLHEASGKVIVMMDDDLQHLPRYIPSFLNEISNGSDVCYSRFQKMRQRYWKVLGSRFNGWVANLLLEKPRSLYLSPYKAISKGIRDLIVTYDGPYPYVDGLILLHTDNISVIDVEHQERSIGEGNYSFRKSLSLWVMMATGFSVKPLRLATFMGFVISFIAFLLIGSLIIFKLYSDIEIEGWASLATIGLFMGGVQLIALGIIGEYIGRSYLKLNRKPQSTVKETTRKEYG
ncbi:MAG: glycosyltransferase family 2 protein, partial [Chlorobium sp.]|nr:glycosyltransferase family 2 protein [Chlorobium sp.]